MHNETPHVPPPHALLDKLIKMGDLKNDSALATKLGILTSAISKIRHGRAPLTDATRCKILRKFDLTIAQVDRLSPPIKEKQK